MSENDFNTNFLNYKANFQIKISKNVYWVPVNFLGKSRYSNNEICKMIKLTPAEKKEKINNLYEAIQLFQLSNFKERNDTITFLEKGLEWEYHKPGIISVLTNEGCCASNTSWLNYILDKKYERTGIFLYKRPDGTGHTYNFIVYEGWYYFIDLLVLESQYSFYRKFETGLLEDYLKSRYITGYLLKCKTFEDYIYYFRRIQLRGGHKFLFFYTNDADVEPSAMNFIDNQLIVYFDLNTHIKQLYIQDKDDKQVRYIKKPEFVPKWSIR